MTKIILMIDNGYLQSPPIDIGLADIYPASKKRSNAAKIILSKLYNHRP